MSLCTRWPAFCFKSILSRVCCSFRERGRKKSPPVHHKWETTFQFWNLWWTECWLKVFCGINAFLKFVFPPQRLQSQRLQTKHFSVAVIILPSRSYSNIPFGVFFFLFFFSKAGVILERRCLRSGVSTGFTVTDTLIKMRILLAWGSCDTCQTVDIF